MNMAELKKKKGKKECAPLIPHRGSMRGSVFNGQVLIDDVCYANIARLASYTYQVCK